MKAGSSCVLWDVIIGGMHSPFLLWCLIEHTVFILSHILAISLRQDLNKLSRLGSNWNPSAPTSQTGRITSVCHPPSVMCTILKDR